MFNSPGSVSIAVLMVLLAIASSLAQGNSKFVGTIKDSSVRDGCGCYFQSLAEVRAQGQGVVFFDADLIGTAWINIDGHDVQLKHVKSKETPTARSGPHRKGDKTIDFYEGGGVKVKVERVVTKTCPANEENCEYVWMRAIITAVKGERRQVVRGVGGCGC
jgi:hypothetical protein